jgi:predicted hotdog family 3-hydroxylacyl-ACP dehydratase
MPAAIEELIPHRAPMRWIDALTESTDTAATASVRLTDGHFALTDGALLETALVECAAQTVAAALGQRLRAGGKPAEENHGMLAAVSSFKITARPTVGQTLAVTVRELKRLGPMLLIEATVTCEGQTIAAGELSLYA